MNGPPKKNWSSEVSLEDKLYTVHYEVDRDHPHITVVQEICSTCQKRICTFICPAGVYVQDKGTENRIIVRHENCLECGTCRVACPKEGIRWQCPAGGMGVRYRFG